MGGKAAPTPAPAAVLAKPLDQMHSSGKTVGLSEEQEAKRRADLAAANSKTATTATTEEPGTPYTNKTLGR